MRTITKTESIEWLAAVGRKVDPCGPKLLPSMRFRVAARIPDSAHDQRLIAHALSTWIGPFETLLWMTEWTSDFERGMLVYRAWCRHLGCDGSPIDAPGHIFDGQAVNCVVERSELIAIMLAFNWEGFMFLRGRESVIWLADEILDVTAHSEEDLDSLRELLRGTGLELADSGGS